MRRVSAAITQFNHCAPGPLVLPPVCMCGVLVSPARYPPSWNGSAGPEESAPEHRVACKRCGRPEALRGVKWSEEEERQRVHRSVKRKGVVGTKAQIGSRSALDPAKGARKPIRYFGFSCLCTVLARRPLWRPCQAVIYVTGQWREQHTGPAVCS